MNNTAKEFEAFYKIVKPIYVRRGADAMAKPVLKAVPKGEGFAFTNQGGPDRNIDASPKFRHQIKLGVPGWQFTAAHELAHNLLDIAGEGGANHIANLALRYYKKHGGS
jgi:hypothetical protein